MKTNAPTPGAENISGPNPREPVTPLEVVNLVLRNARLFIALPLLTAAFAVIIGKIQGPEFEATSSFVANEEGGVPGQAGLLASRFGIDLGRAQGVNLAFYSEVAKSREVLGEVAKQQYTVAGGTPEGRSGSLVDVLSLEGTERQRLNTAIGFLRSATNVTLKRDAGVVEIETEAPSPDLAEQANQHLLEALQEFSTERRRQVAAAEREFLERRLAEAARELEESESAVTAFLEQNRHFQGSPELVNRLTQLRRRVDLRQEVYLGLVSALNQVQLKEARDLPTFRVIDTPEGSARRADLPAHVNAGLGFILGIVAAFFLVLVRQFIRDARQKQPDASNELSRHLRGIRALGDKIIPGKGRGIKAARR